MRPSHFIFIFCLLGIFSVADAFAQDNKVPIASSTNVVRKNEIGVNYAPALAYTLRALPVFPQFALTYKRVVETRYKSLGIRAIATWQPGFDPQAPSEYESSVLLEYRPTESLEIRHVNRQRQNVIGGRLGVEWRYPMRNWQLIMGADGVFRSRTETVTQLEGRYFVGDDCLAQGGDCPELLSENELATKTAVQTTAAVAPFMGFLFRVGRSLTLSAETGFEVRNDFGRYMRVVGTAPLESDGPEGPGFGFLGIRELGIYYRF